MTNVLFDLGRGHFLDGDIDWTADNIKLVFVDHGMDTPLPATDEFLSDIMAGARVATSPNFGTKTSTNGTADAADTVTTSVSGATVESIVIYRDSGCAATSELFVFIDTATGLAFTPNGGDVTVAWSSGADRIFTL